MCFIKQCNLIKIPYNKQQIKLCNFSTTRETIKDNIKYHISQLIIATDNVISPKPFIYKIKNAYSIEHLRKPNQLVKHMLGTVFKIKKPYKIHWHTHISLDGSFNTLHSLFSNFYPCILESLSALFQISLYFSALSFLKF